MMNSNTENRHLKKLTIEKYFTGELSASEAAEFESHLEKCSECSEYLSSLEENQRQFHGAHPFGSFLDAVKEHHTPWYVMLLESLRQPALRPVFAMVLVVCVALPVYMRFGVSRSDLTPKGPGSISFDYRRDGVIKPGTTSDTFQAGDEIQIKYISLKEAYISLFSVDTKGKISFYHPDIHSKWCSVKVASFNKKEHFPSGIALDDTPGNELVVAVFTSKPLAVKTVKEKIGSVLDSEAGNLDGVKSAVESRNLFKKGQVKTIMLNKR